MDVVWYRFLDTIPIIFFIQYQLVLIVHSLDTVADTCQNLVWNCVNRIRQYCHGQFLTEYYNLVALLAVNVRHVNHGYVHADVAHIFSLLAVDEAVAVAVAKMTIESVGIADRYCCDA